MAARGFCCTALADAGPILRGTLPVVRREGGPGAPLLVDKLLVQAARCGACANLSRAPLMLASPHGNYCTKPGLICQASDRTR